MLCLADSFLWSRLDAFEVRIYCRELNANWTGKILNQEVFGSIGNRHRKSAAI